MDQKELRRRLEENLRTSDLSWEELRVQPDPFRGWRIAVVSDDFEEMSRPEREKQVLRGLDDEVFQWIELLTTEEREWVGDLPANATVEDIPMWPEALARKEPRDPVLFATDLDENLQAPIVATFYSMRGGVGRSTALAYTGRILSRRGHSVLCIDMDLEAPGLATLFGKQEEVSEDRGVVPLLLSFEQGESPEVVKHVIRISESDELYCLPAGLPGADYARRVRLIDPESWYREEKNPLKELLASSRDLPFKPDVVLIDARTGMTPVSAPLLFDLSDLALIVFFPHPQARRGTGVIVDAILRASSRRKAEGEYPLTPEPRFIVSPVPDTRIPEVVQSYHKRAQDWIAEWIEGLRKRRPEDASAFYADEVTHYVPYRELIATSDRILDEEEAWQLYEPIALWFEVLLPSQTEDIGGVEVADVKQRILEGLEFSSGTAEDQEDFLRVFVKTSLIRRALSYDKPLVTGRKGTGKTALFRWIKESQELAATLVCAPARFKREFHWIPGPDEYKEIEHLIERTGVGWRGFWTAYSALACALERTPSFAEVDSQSNPAAAYLTQLVVDETSTGSNVLKHMEEMLTTQRSVLHCWELLQTLDKDMTRDEYLLFDGLDTGFGNTKEDRARRTQAIEGLLTFIMDRENELKNLHFKIFLREDIWKRLRFENKSHLYGRSVRLEWPNKLEYIKTALKQALRCTDFANAVGTLVNEELEHIDTWPDASVLRTWKFLAGERMKGSQTAFTVNWVWNRLADGKDDHTPRALFQLLREATEWENREESKKRYESSIIRPRAFIETLKKVSEEALEALLEEFSELEELITRLRRIGRSPVEADYLEMIEELDLAREVGLINVYEGTEEEPLRYRVPDLFRLALGMTRKGEA